MRLVQAVLLLVVSASPAFAQREPEIVIPGKPGVPVYINGVDASWAVVEGEFGLDRPGATAPVVVYSPLTVSVPYVAPRYFPRDGKHPGYGRFEIIPPPNRPLPPHPPSFFRSWSSESAPNPVTEYAPSDASPTYIAPYQNCRSSNGNGRGRGNRAWSGDNGKNPGNRESSNGNGNGSGNCYSSSGNRNSSNNNGRGPGNGKGPGDRQWSNDSGKNLESAGRGRNGK
jgi:hypothetical protein